MLDAVFSTNVRLRGYVVDERGALRKHVSVFVDGAPIVDRQSLNDPVAAGGEVHVKPALSGG